MYRSDRRYRSTRIVNGHESIIEVTSMLTWSPSTLSLLPFLDPPVVLFRLRRLGEIHLHIGYTLKYMPPVQQYSYIYGDVHVYNCIYMYTYVCIHSKILLYIYICNPCLCVCSMDLICSRIEKDKKGLKKWANGYSRGIYPSEWSSLLKQSASCFALRRRIRFIESYLHFFHAYYILNTYIRICRYVCI